MHHLFSEVTDHNPIWTGIQWPETPIALPRHSSSVRITNHPDLPTDKDTLTIYAEALDDAVTDISMHQPDLDQISPQQAGLVQSMVIRASVHQARLLSLARIIRKVDKGSMFKDGFSRPSYMPAWSSDVFSGPTHRGNAKPLTSPPYWHNGGKVDSASMTTRQ
jgi:hypothetical protein